MRLLVTAIVACCVGISCRSAVPSAQERFDDRPLPDLVIKKISYRAPTTSPHLIRQRAGVLEPTYEFELQVENIGNTPFSEQFFVSYTRTLSDFQNSIYTRQKVFNESRAVIAPGKSVSFRMEADVEITRNTYGMSTLPMRFMLSHEWGSYVTRPSTGIETELDYNNNTFELSMRVQLRR